MPFAFPARTHQTAPCRFCDLPVKDRHPCEAFYSKFVPELTFGKYKGQTVKEVLSDNKGYLDWWNKRLSQENKPEVAVIAHLINQHR